MSGTTAARTRWGRPRMGGGIAALLVISMTIGLLLSAALGGLFMWLGGSESPVLAFVVVTAVTLPVSTTLGWAILVDRSTIVGATDRPADSVESAWYEKAASGAFGDILIVGGLGATGFTLAGLDAPAGLVLLAVTAFAMLDFAVRYQWLKKAAA